MSNPHKICHDCNPVKRLVQQSGSYERVPEGHELIKGFKKFLLKDRTCNSSASVSQYLSTVQRWLCSINKLAHNEEGSNFPDLDIYDVHWNVIGEVRHTRQHLEYPHEECGMVEGTVRKYLNHLSHFCKFIERRYHERAGHPLPDENVTVKILRQEFIAPETVKIQRDEVCRHRRLCHHQRMQRHAQLHGTRPAYHHHLELAVILTQHLQILDTEAAGRVYGGRRVLCLATLHDQPYIQEWAPARCGHQP